MRSKVSHILGTNVSAAGRNCAIWVGRRPSQRLTGFVAIHRCACALAHDRDQPLITDNGNYILDCHFDSIPAPEQVELQLNNHSWRGGKRNFCQSCRQNYHRYAIWYSVHGVNPMGRHPLLLLLLVITAIHGVQSC